MDQARASLLSSASFDRSTLMIIGSAYDAAIAKLQGGGHPEAVRTAIARRILSAAIRGERDIDCLCREALRGILLRAKAIEAPMRHIHSNPGQ